MDLDATFSGSASYRRPPNRRDKILRFFSRISIRLLAFNLLLVFLPVIGIVSLETYEDHLLDQTERSMVMQGRLLAAALGGSPLDGDEANRILRNMEQRLEARLRVIDTDYRLVADSSSLGPRSENSAPPPTPAVRENWIYRFGSLLYRGYARIFEPPAPPQLDREFYASAERLDGPEVRRALEGQYGAVSRPSPIGRSLVLYSALPIRSGDEIVGTVLVTRSTWVILKTLWELRLQTFKVIIASVLAAIILSLLVSTTIARPIRRMGLQARALLDSRGRLRGRFQPLQRLDEIGDLSRALDELTRRLEGHIQFIESFASDVSHEFKNPLAAIRNAADLMAQVDDPQDRERFYGMVQRDIVRLEHLLSGVREITRIDAEIDQVPAQEVRLDELLARLVERFEMREGGRIAFHLQEQKQPVYVLVDPDRLAQVFENLLDNAASFSPDGTTVEIEMQKIASHVAVSVRDHGPGIPPEHRERIFDRFFTYRPAAPGKDGHTGLGLAIVKAIIEGFGGSVSARDATGQGAILAVLLPSK